MLFSDRLEIWNPGTLPPSLSKNSGRLTGRCRRTRSSPNR
ncbi:MULTISPECIES: hypothetical protein [Methanoculleus]|nr:MULTISPECIES: hypothetical protein [Methanoculleus]